MTVLITNAPGTQPTIRVTFTGDCVKSLQQVLNRAMNTWDPQAQPEWLRDLSDVVAEELKK